MNLQLLLADECESCKQTEAVWRTLAEEFQLPFCVLSLQEPEGQAVAEAQNLNTFPALMVDGRIKAIGSPAAATARKLLLKLIQKP